MDNHTDQNASFTLPFSFDVTALQSDLEKCMKFDFLGNYIPENYDGKNYILPLRSIEGKINMPAALPGNDHNYRDTEALEACPYFRQVIDTFLCRKETVRLMNLPAGKKINEHTDDTSGYEDGYFRIHVPVVTNDQVDFWLNGKVLNMRAGEAWYTNVNLPHSVENNGATDRIHLVIDCLRNDWSDKLFESMGYDFELEKGKAPDADYSEEVVEQIIANLELQGTPGSQALIDELKKTHGIR